MRFIRRFIFPPPPPRPHFLTSSYVELSLLLDIVGCPNVMCRSYAWAKNMTIGTRLDFNAKTLSFCWEGKPYELAYQEINTLYATVPYPHPRRALSAPVGGRSASV